MRILLVEDDRMIAEGVVAGLKSAGMSVDWVRDGREAEAALVAEDYAVALLDLGLPGADGLDVLKAARRRGVETPILVMTARDGLDDRVAGLDLGADDYLVKPFEPRELQARIRALVRRRAGRATSILVAGASELDTQTHRLARGGVEEVLPAREFALMLALFERPGRILSRAQIETRIYGWGEEVESNAVDVLIHAIRRKFGRDVILNVRGRRLVGRDLVTVSLRRTVLLSTTLLLAAIGAGAMGVAYVRVRAETDVFLDGQLRLIALNAGAGAPPDDAPPAADTDPENEFSVTIWDARGEVVRRSPATVAIPRPDRAGFADVAAEGDFWRVYALRGGGGTVAIAQRRTVREEIIESAALGAAAPIVIVIPLSWLVVGWAMNRALAQLDALARHVAQRSAQATAPIPLEGAPTEIAPLVVSMNGLIERLREATERQRRFLADAAHELRTPLAAIQIEVDNVDRAPQRLAALTAAAQRAGALVDQMLRLARLEAQAPQTFARVDVGAVLLDAVAEVAPLAERKGVDLGASAPEGFERDAPEAELRTLFGALLDNAVRYTPAGGSVEATLRVADGGRAIEILDTGPGLPAGREGQIFDRFFRGDPSDGEGAGLGLAIARGIAERYGFELSVENRGDCSGVRARVGLGAEGTDGLIRS